jgi:hypothetical protein
MKLPNPYTQHELAAARDFQPPNEPFATINVTRPARATHR